MSGLVQQNSKNRPPSSHRPVGFVAMQRLLRVAASDQRMTPSMLRCLNQLASYADKDGECFVAVGTIGKWLGITRQAVQFQLRKVEALGYFNSTRQKGYKGRETTKLYQFNLDIGIQEVSPLPMSQTVARQPTATRTQCKPMALAPGRKRHGLAQNRYKLRNEKKMAPDGQTKQMAWQGRMRREAASRLDSKLRSKLGKEGYRDFLETATPDEFDRLLEQEMRSHRQN